MSAARIAAALRTPRPEVARNIAIVAVASLAAVGLLLTMRRIGGAFDSDLGAFTLAAALLVAGTVVLGGRALWRQAGVVAPPRIERAYAWAGTAAIGLMCVGCAWPNTASFAWLLALPLLAGEHFSRVAFLALSRGQDDCAPILSSTSRVVEASGIPPLAPPFEGGEADEQILQQLTRVRDAAGVESIRGLLHAPFAAGQRHATLHVGFCPPLERLPTVEVEVADGPDAVVKVVQALAHGARLELRLAEPAEEACQVTVEIVASPT